MAGRLWCGCSGWSYAHWREPVYDCAPKSEWLARYAKLFGTVEVNSSFYSLPGRRTVAGWAEHSPDEFVFAVKVSRHLTHVRRLRDVGPGLRRLLEQLEPLIEAGKLGPLLWQLPESFHRDDDRLAAALAEFPRRFRNAVEFRHRSWFCPPVMQLLEDAGVALVVGDHPQRRFQLAVRTAEWAYVRFHYGSAGRRGNYSSRELERWARRLRLRLHRGDVYAYFNNDWEAFAVRNALELGHDLQAAGPTPPRRRGQRRGGVSLAGG
jgi:uncharacterized protein YecE (DUF72 family)